jgi:hypothetical protein
MQRGTTDVTDRSESKLRGYFEPIGKRGFLSSVASSETFSGSGDALEEFPALPDFTIPRLGGIDSQFEMNSKKARSRRDMHGKAFEELQCSVMAADE